MQFFDKIAIWRIVDGVAAKLTQKHGGDTLKLFASSVLMVLSVSKWYVACVHCAWMRLLVSWKNLRLFFYQLIFLIFIISSERQNRMNRVKIWFWGKLRENYTVQSLFIFCCVCSCVHQKQLNFKYRDFYRDFSDEKFFCKEISNDSCEQFCPRRSKMITVSRFYFFLICFVVSVFILKFGVRRMILSRICYLL